ncbi:MAG: DUF4259 domain-containing protein [Massilia sp.]
MGAWAMDAMGNDDAADWAYDLENCADLSLVEAALDDALTDDVDYLEAPEASVAIAAIEVIARLQGHQGIEHEALDAWVKEHPLVPGPALVEKAQQAIARILGENSELKDLWQESENFGAWTASINELAARVAA